MKTFLTYAGTGTNTVRDIFDYIGHRVNIIDNLRDAEHAPADGIILLGGTDINSRMYGESNRFCQKADYTRDVTEWALARRALSKELPLFGICRGAQMIAVACGGSLYQDLCRDGKTAVSHTYSYHPLVKVQRELKKYLPDMLVNSYHHQGIRTLPPYLHVLAQSPDGVIEAFGTDTRQTVGAPILAVQFHPELLAEQNPDWCDLFDWFVNHR